MNSVHLILGIYHYQPTGLADETYEENYQKYYKKNLVLFNEYQEIPFFSYFSGTLLEWIEINHPEYFVLLSEMVKR
ncbi:MAG: alpha-amlyase, partial [Spirochaetes bacterium]